MRTSLAVETLLSFVRAWLLDAYAQCTREYGRVIRVHDVGAHLTRCGRSGCAHERYEQEHGVTWLSSEHELGPCDRFSTGPYIELVYACDCRYFGGREIGIDDPRWSLDDDPNAHGGRWHEHHAVYGAIGEARATCWAS